jgi:hypothetical protein
MKKFQGLQVYFLVINLVWEGKLRTIFSNVVVTFWKVFQSMQLNTYIYGGSLEKIEQDNNVWNLEPTIVGTWKSK